MKKLLVVILLISPVFMAALCDDDLADTPLDSWYEKTITVEETSDDPDPTYAGNFSSISIDDDPTVADYKDKIKNLTVSEIWIEAHNVTGTNLKADIDLRYETGGVETMIGQYNDMVISTGSKIEIVPDQSMLDAMATKLKAGEEITLKAIVVMSDAPFKFDLKARIHVVGTANPL